MRIDIPSDRLPPCPAGRVTEVHSLQGLPEFPSGLNGQLPIGASGLIKHPLLLLFLPYLTLSRKQGKPCRNFSARKAVLLGAQNSNRDLHNSESKALPPHFRQRAVFSFLSQPDRFLGLQMTPAQNKEKQIEMRIVITVKGMRACVSVSMVNAIFWRLILPAVKYALCWDLARASLQSLKIYILFKILLSFESEI